MFGGFFMFSSVNSVGIFGMHTFPVSIEADISQGKFRFDIVGLPDTAVSESKERVRSAMRNSGYTFPYVHITMNLAPADVKKEGPIYDLPILIAILKSTGQLEGDFSDCAFVGELSLGGEVRKINGVLPLTIEARKNGIKRFFVPAANASEGSVVEGIDVYPVSNVKQILDYFKNKCVIEKAEFPYADLSDNLQTVPDFADVKGQMQAKRALEVAAAGGHNVMMVGPPGSGKSMLAKRIPGILPDMTFEESLETTKVFSIAGLLNDKIPIIKTHPFRSPHHSVSAAGLAGGGTVPKPGELSLSHNGVLFLDELPEFSRSAMEVMRQPIEDGVITISRVAGAVTYPCSVMLVCAMNPCPCGFFGHPTKKCTCAPGAVTRYMSKVSGPLIDRIDIHIEVPPVDFDELSDVQQGESSAEIKKRVDKARDIQRERFKNDGISSNAKMTAEAVRKYCVMTDTASSMLKNAFDRLGLSARGYDKVLKVARTVADLDGSDIIDVKHIAEAIQYRSLDRKFWGN